MDNNIPQRIGNNEILPQGSTEIVPPRYSTYIMPEQWQGLDESIKYLLLNIDSFPSQLQGKVPETVWGTLSDQQKLAFLSAEGAVPAFVAELSSGIVEQSPQPAQTESTLSGEVDVSPAETRIDGAGSIAQIEAEHKVQMEQLGGDLQEELQPQQMEAPNPLRIQPPPEQNSPHNLDVKIVGFSPPDEIIANPDPYIDGPIDSGLTWLANIVYKIRRSFSS